MNLVSDSSAGTVKVILGSTAGDTVLVLESTTCCSILY